MSCRLPRGKKFLLRRIVCTLLESALIKFSICFLDFDNRTEVSGLEDRSKDLVILSEKRLLFDELLGLESVEALSGSPYRRLRKSRLFLVRRSVRTKAEHSFTVFVAASASCV